jgi:hypothetical protein
VHRSGLGVTAFRVRGSADTLPQETLMPPDRTTSRIYPDLVAAGSLGAALDASLAEIACPLRSSRQFFGKDSPSFASVDSGHRFAQIYIAAQERKFGLGIWEEHVEMATGWARELSDVALAIQTVLEHPDRKVSELVEGVPFLQLKAKALSHERGTYIEDEWQRFLNHPLHEGGNLAFYWEELQKLIRLAAERPELRRLWPFTSMIRFSVSPTPGRPDTTIPVIYSIGNGRYGLNDYWGGPAVVEGEASVVLDALVERIARGGV